MSDEPVELHPYDPDWPGQFARERELIRKAFATPPLLIEHMGSTSIPGLSAKPIIDIIVLVAALDDGRAAVPALEDNGYSFWVANPDKSKLYLAKGLPPAPRRTHNLHIHDDADEVQRHLIFRDHLRANRADREAYLTLKSELAIRFHNDREAYSKAKSSFIDTVVTRLGGAARRNPW